MIRTSGATSPYRSISPPTAEERHGARPPAVRRATVVTAMGALCQLVALEARCAGNRLPARPPAVKRPCEDGAHSQSRGENMDHQEMSRRIREANGFIAALDQSGGSTPKALAGYGVAPGSWADDAGMFELIHRMRCRIIASPAFNGDKVLGAILFERTMDGAVDGKPVPQALIDRGVIPFLKVDQGLEEERDGVQLMKPIAGLEPLLARAKDLGVFGTKMRSVIKAANRPAIARIVARQPPRSTLFPSTTLFR